MDRNEKLLLLELILRDIRGNWAYDLESRVYKAHELATELGLDKHVEHIDSFIVDMENGDADGRHFRTHYTYGGYEDMSELHGLPHNLFNRSREFREACRDYLTCPELVLDIFGLNEE